MMINFLLPLFMSFCTGLSPDSIDEKGQALADLYGYQWQADMEEVQADMLINVTPLGMAGGEEEHTLSFSEQAVDRASVVFDVVALPPETPLIRYARQQHKTVITGSEVFALQAVEQFKLYTGQQPDQEQFEQAAAYARG